eukprot:7385050-Prymnesium_polylepis.1
MSTTSTPGYGAILEIPPEATNVLFVATDTEFIQHTCDSTLFLQAAPATVLLRNISFSPLPGCAPSSLASPAAFIGITTKGCGETYTDRQDQTWDVCSSRTPGSCSAQPVVGTSLESLSCACPWPELIDPKIADAALAPYQPFPSLDQRTSGCIAPMRLTEVAVISRKVLIDLSKPASLQAAAAQASMERFVNVTLYLEGTDIERPANWSVLN